MRLERPASAVLIEAAMFAVMAGVVAMTAFMVLRDQTFVASALFGAAVGAIVFVVMWLLMRGTMEPPRGAGNIKPTDTPLTKGTAAAPAARAPAPKIAPQAAAKPAAPAPSADTSTETAAPETLSAARDGGPDDLKKIKGVGPKLEKLLNSMGFYHFDQIAGWSGSEVAWVDENLVGFKGRVSRDEWVAQAKALASGKETEFSKRVDDGEVY